MSFGTRGFMGEVAFLYSAEAVCEYRFVFSLVIFSVGSIWCEIFSCVLLLDGRLVCFFNVGHGIVIVFECCSVVEGENSVLVTGVDGRVVLTGSFVACFSRVYVLVVACQGGSGSVLHRREADRRRAAVGRATPVQVGLAVHVKVLPRTVTRLVRVTNFRVLFNDDRDGIIVVRGIVTDVVK